MWEFIDAVLYINLDSRPDRREHMESMTSIFGEKVSRFPAIKETIGHIGCTKSHIGAIQHAISKGWKNVLILEDDAQWNRFDEGRAKLQSLASTQYDVIMLGATFMEHDSTTNRLYKGVSSVGYLVNGHYFQTLLENLTTGLGNLQQNSWNKGEFALDTWWNQLQRRDQWYIVSPCLVYQIPSYSDIENHHADTRYLYQM